MVSSTGTNITYRYHMPISHTLMTSTFSRRTSSSMPFSKAFASLLLIVASSTLLDSKS